MDRRRLAVAVTALAVGLAVAWLMATNDYRPATVADVFVVLAIGWSFVASGLVAAHFRPGNAIGPVMVVTGFLHLGTGLAWSQDPVLFAISHLLHLALFAAVVFILLAFPSGRLRTTFDRAVFGITLVVVGPLNVAWLALGGSSWHGESCVGCPEPALYVTTVDGILPAILGAQEVGAAFAAAAAITVLLRRWRDASPRLRFAIAPVLWVGAAALTALVLYVANGAFGEPLADEVAWIVVNLIVASVAVAFLVGVVRTRLARTAVAELVVEAGEAREPTVLRDSMARALHDPTLEVAYWLADAERYVDGRGRPIDLPAEDESRAVTIIERAGGPIAALVHDPALRDDEDLVASVSAAAALQIENERLQVELRARLEEVEASRTRIVQAAMTERRRIERDLHDGAQQRLVSVAMSLGLAESKVIAEPEAAVGLVREAKGRLGDALAELRAFSQGIHPGILTERGLAAALGELTQRVDLPVTLAVSVPERLPDQVEEAAYYVVSEALTNALKHARATQVHVQVDRDDGMAVTRVADDGRGGADVAGGSGLRGLRDRVEALGGRLTVTSPPAGGTSVEARIPCGS